MKFINYEKNDIAVNEHLSDCSYIFKINKPNDNWADGKPGYIRVKDGEWGDGPYRNTRSRGIRLATPEEILWYNKCAENNKFIPLKEISLDINPQYEIY